MELSGEKFYAKTVFDKNVTEGIFAGFVSPFFWFGAFFVQARFVFIKKGINLSETRFE